MKKINEIKGLEGVSDCYYVTKDGKVLSLKKNGFKELSVKLSSPTRKSQNGYRTVCIMKDNKKYYPKISRLVAMAFVDTNDFNLQVDHIDKNKLNDNYKNLRWVDGKENSRHSNAKEVYLYNKEGFVKKYKCLADCKEDGFNRGHAAAVARGVENYHKGHVFSYKEILQDEVIQRLSKPVRVK